MNKLIKEKVCFNSEKPRHFAQECHDKRKIMKKEKIKRIHVSLNEAWLADSAATHRTTPCI